MVGATLAVNGLGQALPLPAKWYSHMVCKAKM